VSEEKCRQPTVEEAVENVCRDLNDRKFRNHCIEYWRERYGDQFANEVKSKATVILSKRKK